MFEKKLNRGPREKGRRDVGKGSYDRYHLLNDKRIRYQKPGSTRNTLGSPANVDDKEGGSTRGERSSGDKESRRGAQTTLVVSQRVIAVGGGGVPVFQG